ncbi:MAG: GYD domain-containing protein [Desulfuromonadales bacterium]|nr:GYD domain-containing protein [Desulfuromonadales bacterium]
MLTFVMLTRLSPGALHSPRSLEELEQQVKEEIQTDCPEVEWVHNYAILGDCDYLDIFKAPDMETALKVATIVRTFGHAHTEMWTATEWRSYKNLIRELPEHAAREAGDRERVHTEHHAQHHSQVQERASGETIPPEPPGGSRHGMGPGGGRGGGHRH